MDPQKQPAPDTDSTSLSKLVVTYDMRKLMNNAKSEFENVVSSQELVDQNAINAFFNLEEKRDERN